MEGLKILKVPPDWSRGYDYFKVTLNINGKNYFGSYAIKKGIPYQKAIHEHCSTIVEENIRELAKKRNEVS